MHHDKSLVSDFFALLKEIFRIATHSHKLDEFHFFFHMYYVWMLVILLLFCQLLYSNVNYEHFWFDNFLKYPQIIIHIKLPICIEGFVFLVKLFAKRIWLWILFRCVLASLVGDGMTTRPLHLGKMGHYICKKVFKNQATWGKMVILTYLPH